VTAGVSRAADLERIASGLEAARRILAGISTERLDARYKRPGDPVTEADLAVDAALRDMLPAPGEGWLSEETADDPARLACSRVWIVDPLDGTREFIEGIPEWSVCIGLVEDGAPVAGGIANPATGEVVLGAVGLGVTLDGVPCRVRDEVALDAAEVLASRSECRRGEWAREAATPMRVRPVGSVGYKLALVAAGRADATWTRVPKSEWDVAAGAALVLAAGGEVWLPGAGAPRFNQPRPRFSGLVASSGALAPALRAWLGGTNGVS
jgi:myo-inositol-1(or 4)-monophosphatase